MKKHFSYIVAILPVLLVGAALAVVAPPPIDRLREVVFDNLQRLAPRSYDSALPVRIVAIDEASLTRIGQWPWPRDKLAALTSRLAEAGAAVIAFDILFGEPDQTSPDLLVRRLPDSPERKALEAALAKDAPSHDTVFASVFSQAPVVLGFVGSGEGPPVVPKCGFATAGDDPRPWVPRFRGARLPISPLLGAAPGLGAVNWVPDGDSVIRRVPTVIVAGGALAPSLSLEALRLAQGANTIVIRSSNASGQTAFGHDTGVNAVKVGDLAIETENTGETRLWARPAEPKAWISAADVLDGRFDDTAIAGRIVIVGAVALGLGDRRTTPVEESVPGVEVHAQAIEQILTGVRLVRPDWMSGFEAAVILLIGAALALFMRWMRDWPTSATLASLALPLALGAASWFLFSRSGLLMDPIIPSAALLATTLAATAFHYGEAERRRAEVRRIFGRFVTPAVVERLVETPDRIVLGGELRSLTILFSDVRDFTSLSEERTPEGVVSLVRSIHTPATAAVLAEGGTVDKYIGDGMMAFWNAPLEDPEHAAKACRAALGIAAAMRALSEPSIRVGIGIHTGEACVGNVGSDQRLEYSALGDAVNLASRIENLTKLYGVEIIVSDTTARAAPEFAFLELDRVRVKGRHGVTALLALHGTEADEAFRLLAACHNAVLDAYRKGEREATRKALENAECHYGERYRRLFAYFHERIARMKEVAPPTWDGIHTLEHE
jgi:adenylate cyclase